MMPHPSRRMFLTNLATAAMGPAVLGRRAFAQSFPARVDPTALRQRIESLSLFGRPSGGTFADGVSRVAYSDADVAGRRYTIDLMRAAGLDPRIDAAGNIFGRRAGTDASLPPILFGSHIDSVPNGGNFDGDLGSLAALGVLEAWRNSECLRVKKTGWRKPAHAPPAGDGRLVGRRRRGLHRGLNGSRIVAGDVKPSEMDDVWNGMTRADAIRRIGGEPGRIMEAIRPRGAHHCYLELHIEQGGTLERQGIPVGVVEGIVSIDRHEVTVTGFANHAGTTQMADRQDALLAASHLTIAVRQIVSSDPGRQVGTVGRLDVSPNAPNVIPGVVRLTIELRDLSPEKSPGSPSGFACARPRSPETRRHRSSSRRSTTRRQLRPWKVSSRNAPATAAVEVQQAIERSAGRLGLATQRMPSGAGHDAQMMAQLSPMGMIFVPSVRGISHSPLELTRWEDCAQGRTSCSVQCWRWIGCSSASFMHAKHQDEFAPILASAQRQVSKTLGRDVCLGDVERLSEDDRRNLLLRSRDLSGGSPASFIIKKVVVDAYDPGDAASWDTRRFFSDWVGAEFLSTILDARRSPRFYGGDDSMGFFILEDLGEHRSLVEPLLEEDAASAERALLNFSACLGALHAGTIGQSAKFEGLLRAISPQVGTLAHVSTGLGERVTELQSCLDGLGVPAGVGFTEELDAIVAAIESRGPFFSYIHGDPCPDNVFWNGEELRLIDFEFGGFGHALMDAAYGRMLFPSCWCANRLPQRSGFENGGRLQGRTCQRVPRGAGGSDLRSRARHSMRFLVAEYL